MTKPKPTQAPSESPEGSTPETKPNLRERVKTFTDRELDGLMDDIEAKRQDLAEVQEGTTQAAIEKRMEEVQVADAMKARWQQLRASLTPEPSGKIAEMQKKAEESFLKKMVEKGGIWAVVGSVGITVLAWLGFKSAKALRASIKEKGFLRTAVEGAKEHPIFAGFIAALGIKAGSEAFQYLKQNEGAIEEFIVDHAGKTGQSTIDAAKTIGSKVAESAVFVRNQTARGLAHALALVGGGKYDEETGVVTLENKLFGQKTLRPPFVIAWQAGIRADGGATVVKKAVSLFIVEDRFDAILRQKNIVDNLRTEANAGLILSAKRGKDLMSKGVRPGMNTKESKELEKIIELAIKADPELQKAKPLEVKAATEAEINERLKHVEAEMESFYKQKEIPTFNKVRDSIHNNAVKAERDLNDPKMKGKEKIRQDAIDTFQSEIAKYDAEIPEQKVALCKEQVDLMNAKADLLAEHAGYKLDKSMGPSTLDKSVKMAEGMGSSIVKTKVGKYAVGIVGCYSFLPLATQGIAALQKGKEGEAAWNATKVDIGEAVGGFIPGVGEVLDFRSAIMGTDMNGRELDTWSRVTAGAMGTLGTASIVAGFFTGGTSIVAFRALRGAVGARNAAKIVKLAKEGVEVTNASSKTLNAIEKANVAAKTGKAVDNAAKEAKALEKMLEVTNTQKNVRKFQKFVHNGQRGMQLYTYGMLGWSMGTGVMEIYRNTDEFIDTKFEQAGSIMKAGGEFIDAHIPKSK